MELIIMFHDGLLQYLLLCFISVAMGLGLLRVLRLDLPPRMALAFAPVLTLGCWSIVLGIGVAFRMPVRYLAGPLWGLTLAFVLIGVVWALVRMRTALGALPHNRVEFVATSAERRAEFPLGHACRMLGRGWPVATCVLLPLAVMFPYFVTGLTEHPRSSFPDGWVYMAFGQYLWSYPRGTEGGLAILYQYSANLSQTRFIASALLGFLSPFFLPGDTQMASGLFLAWALFTLASSCAFFGFTQRLSASRLLIYISLVIWSGWICNMIWANNYDNALALAYFPALVGVIGWLQPRSWAWRAVLGLLGAGLVYCYPEFAFGIFGGTTLVAIDRFRVGRQERHHWLITTISAFGLMVALVTPYLSQMYNFLRAQVAVGLQVGARPAGGLFVGLLQLHYLPAALWGLGGEHQLDSWLFARNMVGIVLLIFAALGFVRLSSRRHFGFAALILVLSAACGLFIVSQQYAYGAYKVILLGWWAICYLVVLGLDRLLLWFRTGILRYAAVGLCAATLLSSLLFNHYAIGAPNRIPSHYDLLMMSEFRQLDQIKRLTNGAGILVMVDDWLANYWALYYLRDTPIALGVYRMHLAQPRLRPLIERARTVGFEQVGYVLTDGTFDTALRNSPGTKLVWSGGPYHLWELSDRRIAVITAVTNDKDFSLLNKATFFWMDTTQINLQIYALRAGQLTLQARFVPGPSLPETQIRHLRMTSDTWQSETVISGGVQQIQLPVNQGINSLHLMVVDSPTQARATNGDTRTRLLGIQDLTARFVP